MTFSPRSREETCRESSQQLRFLNPLLVIALLQLTADVLEAALEGVGQLAGGIDSLDQGEIAIFWDGENLHFPKVL